MWISSEVAEYQSALDWNVYPHAGGSLLGNGSQLYSFSVDTDFNGTPRDPTRPTIGAYEITPTNADIWKPVLGKRERERERYLYE